MGVASLANVLTNISKYFDAHKAGAEGQAGQHPLAEGHARGQSGFALSDIFVSTTLGARIANINVSSSANAEFAGLEPQTYAWQGCSPKLADRVPSRPATHTFERARTSD
eukprot:scaffold102655_cov54-Phaeocystis_antarctica.AAC.1